MATGREGKLPGLWVFIPPLFLGMYIVAAALLGIRTQLPSGYRFIFFVAPMIGGAASLAGLLALTFHSKSSIALAVLATAACWVPLFFFLFLAAPMVLRSGSLF